MALFVEIGMATAATFGIMFAPFVTPFPELPLYVLHRIFPVARGKTQSRVALQWRKS